MAWGAVYVCRGGVLNLMALNIEEEEDIGYIYVSLSTTGNECTLKMEKTCCSLFEAKWLIANKQTNKQDP